MDGIWTAMALSMTNTVQRTRTDLSVTSAKYNVGLSESAFTRRQLEQPGPVVRERDVSRVERPVVSEPDVSRVERP
jgi:hypothetical protein